LPWLRSRSRKVFQANSKVYSKALISPCCSRSFSVGGSKNLPTAPTPCGNY
jgi:hypothetical protein